MTGTDKGSSKRVVVKNELGLHARPAALIAKMARNARAGIWIARNKNRVDAASVIDILTLSCKKDCEITLIIDDESDADILNDIVDLIESGFGE
jgi:phosphotransferase system HPr (HPr) family protein